METPDSGGLRHQQVNRAMTRRTTQSTAHGQGGETVPSGESLFKFGQLPVDSIGELFQIPGA